MIYAIWHPGVDDVWFAAQNAEDARMWRDDWLRNDSGWDTLDTSGFKEGWVEPREDGLYQDGVKVYSCPTIHNARAYAE